MPLHLIKLCVGATSIQDLEGWIAGRLALQRAKGLVPEQAHTTRMMPKRQAELLDGGSLYWVIKSQMAARQKLLDIRPFVDGDGISRCDLILDPVVVPVRPRPCRPFQGWRYLKAEEAPSDLGQGEQAIVDMPEELRRTLSGMGLL